MLCVRSEWRDYSRQLDGLQTGTLVSNVYSGSATLTPTLSGTYTYALTCGGQESGFATLTVAPLSIATTGLPLGTAGTAYTASLAASSGTAPYKWSISSGSLPPGLTLSASTGAISGTPTGAGTSSFRVVVTDSEETPVTATTELSLTIEVSSDKTVSTAATPNRPERPAAPVTSSSNPAPPTLDLRLGAGSRTVTIPATRGAAATSIPFVLRTTGVADLSTASFSCKGLPQTWHCEVVPETVSVSDEVSGKVRIWSDVQSEERVDDKQTAAQPSSEKVYPLQLKAEVPGGQTELEFKVRLP